MQINTLISDSTDRHCALAHDLTNKLAVIVGYCDLMMDDIEEDDLSSRRLAEIRQIALSMAKSINGHDCRMLASTSNHLPSVQPLLTSL